MTYKRNKMLKSSNKFKIGTRVKCDCCAGWHIIKEIHETRHWIKVTSGHGGSLQRNHIIDFFNPKKQKDKSMKDVFIPSGVGRRLIPKIAGNTINNVFKDGVKILDEIEWSYEEFLQYEKLNPDHQIICLS